MEFDWTTFSLEIVNFLILVWVLKRFFYHPILGVIARRRAGIEKTLADARRIESEASELRQQHERNLARWAEEKEAAQARLQEELAAERERKMAVLETTISEERERRSVQEERRRQEFERNIEEQCIAQGAAFSARLLSRAATPELEARLYALLLEDLRSLGAQERAALADVATMEGAPGLRISVQSAYPLDEARRSEMALALEEVLGKPLPVEYHENEELVAGFQLNIGPWILHANLRDELKFFSGALRYAE